MMLMVSWAKSLLMLDNRSAMRCAGSGANVTSIFRLEQDAVSLDGDCKSMAQWKKDITPLLMHWSYVLLALIHWNEMVPAASLWTHKPAFCIAIICLMCGNSGYDILHAMTNELLWDDQIIRNKIRANCIFIRFGLWAPRLFVKWVFDFISNNIILFFYLLKHWEWDKWPLISRRYFHMHFLERI